MRSTISLAIDSHLWSYEPLILLSFKGHWEGYDSKIDPSALDEFITSAFRFGHSLLPQRIERWNHKHTFIG